MKIKFNWGTGIFTFIGVFLIACATFIIFTVRQGVNLVHKDYYKKGSDYSEQIRINQRSLVYKDDVKIIDQNELLVVNIKETLAVKIDSGVVQLYRPSDSKMDLYKSLEKNASKIVFPKDQMLSGRYILKLYWFSDGVKYGIDRPINIQ